MIDTRTDPIPALIDATRTGTRRPLTTHDRKQLQMLVQLGAIERVIASGQTPRIRYRRVEGWKPSDLKRPR